MKPINLMNLCTLFLCAFTVVAFPAHAQSEIGDVFIF